VLGPGPLPLFVACVLVCNIYGAPERVDMYVHYQINIDKDDFFKAFRLMIFTTDKLVDAILL
jgi:hypothetical protein